MLFTVGQRGSFTMKDMKKHEGEDASFHGAR